MNNLFRLEENIVYLNENLIIDSDETEIKSGLDIIPIPFTSYKEYNCKTGQLIKSIESGGISILKYLNDSQPIAFSNKILREKTKDVSFKFCCDENVDCVLKKDTPIIEIIENIDHDFKIEELDLSNLNEFFKINDLGSQKDVIVNLPIELQAKRHYTIKSGIKIHRKEKYLFLARLLWKYGLIIQRSMLINDSDNVLFNVYNAENKSTVVGEHEHYNIIYSIFKLKEK